MPDTFRKTLHYYRSSDFSKDYANFARRDPESATHHLWQIVEQFNENLKVLGLEPTTAELTSQSNFFSSNMSTAEMIELVKTYAVTIDERLPG